MGFLSKIWKGVKKVGSKIVGGITKIGDALTGGNFSKWMEKGWVQKAMMAATLLTGGIAIVNGVMQGWTQGAAALSKTGSFSNAFVTGATEFVKGVGAGLANPVDVGKDLLGKAGDALGFGGEAVAASEGALGASGPSAPSQVLDASGSSMPTSDAMSTMIDGSTGKSIAPQSIGAPPSVDLMAPQSLSPDAFFSDGLKEVTTDHLSRQVANAAAPAAEQGWLQSLKSGAKDFISSPVGMQTAASAVSGWAQGQALEEQWQRMDDERKRKRETWTGFASRAPQFNMDSGANIRDRRTQMYDRGDIAQAKFGY